jgi:hypothetical protein
MDVLLSDADDERDYSSASVSSVGVLSPSPNLSDAQFPLIRKLADDLIAELMAEPVGESLVSDRIEQQGIGEVFRAAAVIPPIESSPAPVGSESPIAIATTHEHWTGNRANGIMRTAASINVVEALELLGNNAVGCLRSCRTVGGRICRHKKFSDFALGGGTSTSVSLTAWLLAAPRREAF